MCLTWGTTEKDPKQGSPLSAYNGRSFGERQGKEVFWPATRGLKIDSDRATTPAGEAVHVPAHLAPPGSLQAKQLHHLHTQLSVGQSCHGQKHSCIYAHIVTSVVSNSLRRCRLWPARFLSGRGVLQARILEHTGQYWLPYPSRALYFLLPKPPTPLSTWCCQNH